MNSFCLIGTSNHHIFVLGVLQHLTQVQFNSDAIDETDLLEETLRPRIESIGGTLEKVRLNGNHLTPCIQVKKPSNCRGSNYAVNNISVFSSSC